MPEQRAAIVAQRRASLPFSYTVGAPETYVFTVDIYAYMDAVHPDRHLGWWRFELPPGRGQGMLEMSFEPIDGGSVQVMLGERRVFEVDPIFRTKIGPC